MFGFSPFSGSAFSDIAETGSIAVAVTGIEAAASLASVLVRLSGNIRVTGLTATGVVQTTSVVAGCKVFAAGVQAAALVTTPLVWSVINDNQTPNWTPVNDTQAGSWIPVNDGNTVIWTQIPT